MFDSMETSPVPIELFFRSFLEISRKASADTPALWGKMSFQGAIEHLEDSLLTVLSEDLTPFVPENQEALINFILSPKPFRENTKHPKLPPDPLPLRHPTLSLALENLNKSIDRYLDLRAKKPEIKPVHPGFGSLAFAVWDALIKKHFEHHLQQFNLLPR